MTQTRQQFSPSQRTRLRRARRLALCQGGVGVREPFRHRCKYIHVSCGGAILAPTLPKGLAHTDVTR